MLACLTKFLSASKLKCIWLEICGPKTNLVSNATEGKTVVGDSGTTENIAIVCNELVISLPLKWLLQKQGPGFTFSCTLPSPSV